MADIDPSRDSVELYFDMQVRYTIAHPFVEENIGQVAIERGPLLYCLETPDASVEDLGDLRLPFNADFVTKPYTIADQMIGHAGQYFAKFLAERPLFVTVTTALAFKKSNYDDKEALYQTLRSCDVEKVPIRLIPYFAWDNRGDGEMLVWFPVSI